MKSLRGLHAKPLEEKAVDSFLGLEARAACDAGEHTVDLSNSSHEAFYYSP